MHRKLLLGSCGVTLALAAVVSCSMDTRTVSLANALRADGDASTPFGNGGDGQGGPGTAPVLAVEPASIDFGSAVVGSPSRARLSIVNSGDAPLAAPQTSMSTGSDPDFIVLHDQCDNAIAPGERCDVRLQLLPSKAGPSSAILGVEGDGQSTEVPLAGAGLESGPLTLAPAAGSSRDFGGVVVGSSLEAHFDVSNSTLEASGALTFAVNEPQFELLPPAAGDCEPGITSLVDGQTCRIRVGFTPARRGPVDASLLVTSANLRSTSLPLAGVGRQLQTLVAPDSVEFGEVPVGSAGQRTLQVENLGDEPLQLSSVALAGGVSVPADVLASAEPGIIGTGSNFSVQNSDCGAGNVLVGGARCGVTVAFRPLAVADRDAQLIITAADGTQHPIHLVGSGVPQGALTISPAVGGSSDFGALAVASSSAQTFIVSNTTAQPSGLIEFRTNDDFAIVERGAENECKTGVTSLVNGQSCELAVTLTPSGRGQRDGALIARSALAGTSQLALTGRGLGLAKLALASNELDFGRVPTETPVQQSVTVLNTGEQALAAVQATLTGPGGGAPVGFSIQNSCTGELAGNSSCGIVVEFSAPDAASYSAVLQLSSNSGGSTSALLLGLAFPRGSLVLASAEGVTDFGDVALGTPRTIAFTLTNPSATPSGRLTIISSNPRFTIDPGDCNAATGAGLVNGESCTFSVSFNPITSDVVAANLSVQSPGAGETAQPLTGRGRTPPDVNATGTRDFGVSIIDQNAINEPANEFTWTVTNDGDLPSGTLVLTNANPAEFVVSNDTCTGASIAGHGSCSMDVRFLASAIGSRTANLVLTDPVSTKVLTLVMTGTGVVIAQPGQSCANGATCATGQCTGGVCCDRDCAGSCQVCSATGICSDQAAREACGNGNGRCFGVNQCLLPDGQACSGDEQCGNGNCETRLAGAGSNDRICCLEDCAAGLVCNAQGRCQPPTLAAGVACGAAGQLPCGAGLECKSCFGGGRQCTPPDVCCGGCGPASDYECINGECSCPTGSNGVAQLDCGSGQCVLTQQFACCAVAPECPAARPVCNGPAGLCVQCLANSDCGPCSTCSANNTCTPLARGQAGGCNGGQLCNGSGACFAPQCTGVGQCGDCRTCSNFSCVNAGQGATCSTGVCTADQRCVRCVANAQCGAGQRCELSNNTCVPSCVASTEVCDGRDNNCDGQSDEGFSLQTDPNNCGECGERCGGGCTGGRCDVLAASLVTTAPSGTSFDLGETVERTTSTVTWVIANVGNASTGTLAVTSSDPLNFAPAPASCPPIAPGAECRVSINFTPQITLQVRARADFRAVLTAGTLSYIFEGTARPPNQAGDP